MSRKDRHRRPQGREFPAAPAGRRGVDDMLLGYAGQAFAPLPDAAALAQSAAQIRPDPIALALAQSRREAELDKQIASLRQALGAEPNSFKLLLLIGELEMRARRHDAALALYDRCLEIAPERDDIRHMIAALGGGALPARAADAYIANLFDGFAASFDQTLVQWLDYRGPEFAHKAALAALGANPPPRDVIDLGCGTGLNAPLFRALARRLDGVDLSAGMIAKARARKLYDELTRAEIVGHLMSVKRRYGLALATDVLVYFGDLVELFAATARVLKANGLFIATIEQGVGAPFALARSGRYVHGDAYLRHVAGSAGFSVQAMAEFALRHESRKPVAGAVYTLRKQS